MKLFTRRTRLWMSTLAACVCLTGAGPSDKKDTSRTIFGIVMEQRSGTPDNVVVLCDGKTGYPLTKDFKPFVTGGENGRLEMKNLATVITDERGRFEFAGVPEGAYRLVALKWTGPFKGLFEVQGTVVQLLGVKNDIKVPRPPDEKQRIVLTPPGERILQFRQDIGNDDTLLLLSTKPPEFDAVLGFDSLGKEFLTHVIGVHRMPDGKSTVLNAPSETVYGLLFVADNLPGYAHVTIEPSQEQFVSVPPVQFIASWSNGKRTPEGEIAKLVELLEKNKISVEELLEIPPLSNATAKEHNQRIQELRKELSRKVEVIEGKKYRVGDLMAAWAYQRAMRK